ncbi:hypothetical protein FACS189468_8910 [Spirochaetia bacterium]|nr:hypothetical protein FACS189468_8910 [Spirochaetia bacterium]
MELVYKAETEKDINDLADCALSIRAVVALAKETQESDIKDDLYWEKIETFTLIETLLKPILTFLTDEATDIYGGRLKIKKPA